MDNNNKKIKIKIKILKDEKYLEVIEFIEKENFPSNYLNLESIKKIFLNKNFKIIILYETKNNKLNILSYAIILDVLDAYEIIKIATIEKYRENGYGTEILNFIKNLEREKIFLEVRESNHKAINFYKINKFKKIHIRKKYYTDTNEDAIIMIHEK
ncbi:MAG: GNAT family N-acetyltransferase [Fusobacteriaceae bacterium]|jgi:ribosomal-protein-alanine N-acetyltransferase|nr:GNAT family N-acetyltransferase [Fusobacteriaceae bacterium]